MQPTSEAAGRQSGPPRSALGYTTMLCFSHDVIYKVKKVFIVILIPKPSLNFRTGWSVGEHALAWWTHLSAPGSINSKRITAKPAREGFVSMCACTGPVRTFIGAVRVEYGRPKWPITMLNHTSLVQKCFHFLFLAPYACSYDPLWRGFLAWRQKTASVASLPRPCLIITNKKWYANLVYADPL